MSQSGDAANEVEVVQRRIHPRLNAFAVALTGSPRAAAGLVQATMARLEAGSQARRGQVPLMLWAYKELHALWLQGASEHAAEGSAGRADPRCFATPADTPEAAARNRGLARMIADLPAQQRATLLLVYGEGLSYDEVAEVFDSDIKSVMTRVVRGHVAVGHWLDRRAADAADVSPADEGYGGGAARGAEGQVA